MSRFEDEEEDELQMILEGRDVEDYREYYENRREDNRSEHSESDRDPHSHQDFDDQRSQSLHSKKQSFDDSFSRSHQKTKRKISSSRNQLNRTLENDFRDEHNSRETQTNVNNQKNDENENKLKVKVRRTLRPQPKLNADRLTATEGLPVLPQIFSDFKFGRKGTELKDLNAILFRFSHWSHRLFPSLTFDDFIDKCEQLGNKRPLKTFVSKIRYDLPLNLEPNETQLEDDDQQNEGSNDRDFDFIISNTNITENNEIRELQTNDSYVEDLTVGDKHIEEQSLPINGLQLETHIKNNVSEPNDKHIDDSNDDELSEQQILNQINSEDDSLIY